MKNAKSSYKCKKAGKPSETQQGKGVVGDWFKQAGKDVKKTYKTAKRGFNKLDDLSRKYAPIDLPLQGLARIALNPEDPLAYMRLHPFARETESRYKQIKKLAQKGSGKPKKKRKYVRKLK